jgi:hypothetical protein
LVLLRSIYRDKESCGVFVRFRAPLPVEVMDGYSAEWVLLQDIIQMLLEQLCMFHKN